ncbi:MAG TPA: PVC-type heme-binding CxxCH protein [Pirellulales bacterium]|nr:PVC-type heme-binding CxxCH protein [Pirellulales bacterium]
MYAWFYSIALIVTGADAAPQLVAHKLYVANSAGNDIHVIDTATNRVIKRVEVGPQPHGLVATAKGDRLFITIENTGGEQGELLWFDPATDTVTRRMTVGPRPNQLACTPDGRLVYIPCDDASWWVVDTERAEVITKIATGGRPHNTLCSPDGQRMYLGPKGSYHVLIADARSHRLIGEIPLSDAPRPIALSRDEKRLYANVDTLIGFEVCDVQARKVIHRVEADVPEELLRKASRSHGIALSPDEKELWMCDVFHDRTYVFDVAVSPPRQVATITMQGGGYWLCFAPDGRKCYISERIGNTVAVVDTASREIVEHIAVGQAPKRVLVVSLPAAKRDEAALPRVAPKEPAEALKTFETLDGFRMKLLAAEPLVTDPVAMAYDENGLAYVVEMSDYPYTDKSTDQPFVERTGDLPLGRVRVLEDTDGDGDFDRSTIFARDLSWPTGLAFWKGGVFVAATPDVWYLKDTDGDRRADVRRKVFSGFRKFNVQAVMNNLAWGLDQRIYGAGSSNGGQIRPADQPQARAWTLGRNDFRFDPRDDRFELLSGGARFGNTFDDWGNRFVCNIRNPVQHVVLPSRYLARNPYLPVAAAVHDAAAAGDTLPVYRISPPEAWRVVRAERWSAEANPVPRSETSAVGYFTSTSGVTIYRGAAYPAKYYGNAFLGEVAANVVHRQVLSADGVTFRAERGDANTEFVRSTDNWFRPVNFVNAPDGTLHVLDMYRETIEHPWSIPDDIKAQLDLESGRDRGRIYRLSPPGFQPPAPPQLGAASDKELVAQLENPNAWWRETAHRLLFERQRPEAVAPLRKLLTESRSPLARLHALWSLEGLQSLTGDDLLRALGDESPGVREHAVRLAEPRLRSAPQLAQGVLALAHDEAIRVRFQAAFSLGELLGPAPAVAASTGSAADGQRNQTLNALSTIARRDAADPWVGAAVLSSVSEVAPDFLANLLADRRFVARSEAIPLLQDLAAMIGARNRATEIADALRAVAASEDENAEVQAALLIGLAGGLRRAGSRPPKGLLSREIAPAGSPAASLISRQLKRARQLLGDADVADDRRRRAIELLAVADYHTSAEALGTLLSPREAQTIQLAAVRALSGYTEPAVANLLLQHYAALTPGVRGEIVQALLARGDRIIALLDAIEDRRIQAADVPAARRKLLTEHADPEIRRRAEALFAQDAPTPRRQVLDEYRPALDLAGDRQRGERVFQRECQACHRQGDRGHDVGPNLLSIKHRTRAEVLTHVLDPNREVAPNFQEYVVALDDGRIVTGIIADETATSVTLRRAERIDETILRRNIDEMSGTGHSLMPEGVEKKINHQEMADLLEYLLGP